MSLAIADSGVGIAAGGSGTIVRCADGSSWSLVRAGGAEELNGIAAAGDVMCVVGSEGVRLSSQDGGLTWAEAAGRPAGDLIAVALTKSGNGIAVGRRGLTEIHLK